MSHNIFRWQVHDVSLAYTVKDFLVLRHLAGIKARIYEKSKSSINKSLLAFKYGTSFQEFILMNKLTVKENKQTSKQTKISTNFPYLDELKFEGSLTEEEEKDYRWDIANLPCNKEFSAHIYTHTHRHSWQGSVEVVCLTNIGSYFDVPYSNK